MTTAEQQHTQCLKNSAQSCKAMHGKYCATAALQLKLMYTMHIMSCAETVQLGSGLHQVPCNACHVLCKSSTAILTSTSVTWHQGAIALALDQVRPIHIKLLKAHCVCCAGLQPIVHQTVPITRALLTANINLKAMLAMFCAEPT